MLPGPEALEKLWRKTVLHVLQTRAMRRGYLRGCSAQMSREGNRMKGSKPADFACRLAALEGSGVAPPAPVRKPHLCRSSMWIPRDQVRTSMVGCLVFGVCSLPLVAPLHFALGVLGVYRVLISLPLIGRGGVFTWAFALNCLASWLAVFT